MYLPACLTTLRPIWSWSFGGRSNNAGSSINSGPRILTIGSGPSKSNRKRDPDESLLGGTVNDSEHPFHPILELVETGARERFMRTVGGAGNSGLQHMDLRNAPE